jgi:predicted RNA-binding protein with PUA-like domain
MPQYWLMKTEPETFSIDDLERVKVEPWSGVRSMFARFHMRHMTVGDPILFYHSSCEPPGVAGLAKVVRTRVIDETQFDPASKYFDPKATREKPIWDCVDVELVTRLPRFVSLAEIRADAVCADMMLLKRGMRLSVQPIDATHYARIVAMAGEPAPPDDVLKAAARMSSPSSAKPRGSVTKAKTKSKAKAKTTPRAKTKPKTTKKK